MASPMSMSAGSSGTGYRTLKPTLPPCRCAARRARVRQPAIKAERCASIVMAAFDALAGEARWVAWRNELRHGKKTKVPYAPRGGKAKADNPFTWGNRAAAEARAAEIVNGSGGGIGDSPLLGTAREKAAATVAPHPVEAPTNSPTPAQNPVLSLQSETPMESTGGVPAVRRLPPVTCRDREADGKPSHARSASSKSVTGYLGDT